MEILEILQNNGKDLLPDEIDLLKTELDTGDYETDYIEKCKVLISELTNCNRKPCTSGHRVDTAPAQEKKTKDEPAKSDGGGIPVPPPVPPEKAVASDLLRIRMDRDYRSSFKKYVRESPAINEEFVVANFSLFKEWEISAMLACIQFSEEYLEQYFSVLDPKMIALHQRFSENFFIKHYAELDAETVLSRGVNPWRNKSLRSKWLDVFLRLKGVKL